MKMSEVTYSFSRLKLFNECRHAYFLSYVMKCDKKPNIYSEIGTTIHELLEDIQGGKEITPEERVEIFEDKVDECKIFAFQWFKIHQTVLDIFYIFFFYFFINKLNTKNLTFINFILENFNSFFRCYFFTSLNIL